MKKLFLILSLMFSSWSNATPFDSNYITSDLVSDKLAVAAANIIKIYGYRCDSISSARPMYFSHGYVIQCNSFRYEYEIRGRGGRWVVTIN